jgi:threonine dehydrogenase-like Zn-dependent dehydrogenase
MLGTMALLVRGYKVTVYSQGARGEKVEFAESIGAQLVTAADEPLENLAGHLGRIDVMFEATGATPQALAAMQFLGRNGVYLLTGIPGRRGAFTLDAGFLLHGMVQKNQVILGPVHPSAEAYRAAIQDLGLFSRRWPGALPSLVSGRVPLDDAPEAFRQMGSGLKRVVTVAD